MRVRIAPGTLRPCSSLGRAASLYLAGSRFDSGRGLLMGGGGNWQTRQALTLRLFQVRALGTQLMPS